MKMSSLLNVSNGKPKEFILNDIEVLADDKEQNWFKREHIGLYLGIAHIITSTSKLSEEDKKTQPFLQAEGGICSMDPPKEDAQDYDILISLTGALYAIVNSRKYKGKVLKKLILKDIVARGFDVKIKEAQGKHQQAIKEKDNQTQALESTNEKKST